MIRFTRARVLVLILLGVVAMAVASVVTTFQIGHSSYPVGTWVVHVVDTSGKDLPGATWAPHEDDWCPLTPPGNDWQAARSDSEGRMVVTVDYPLMYGTLDIRLFWIWRIGGSELDMPPGRIRIRAAGYRDAVVESGTILYSGGELDVMMLPE